MRVLPDDPRGQGSITTSITYFLTCKSDIEKANTMHSYHHPGKGIWLKKSEGNEMEQGGTMLKKPGR